MSVNNSAPGAEGSLERFIVKCALTLWPVRVRPSLFYIPLQVHAACSRGPHISANQPEAPLRTVQFSDVLRIMSHILMSPD